MTRTLLTVRALQEQVHVDTDVVCLTLRVPTGPGNPGKPGIFYLVLEVLENSWNFVKSPWKYFQVLEKLKLYVRFFPGCIFNMLMHVNHLIYDITSYRGPNFTLTGKNIDFDVVYSFYINLNYLLTTHPIWFKLRNT